MNQLEQNTISSREVAEMMEVKRHSDMLDKIDKINQILTNGNFRSSDYWYESQYKAGNGEMRREYQVTKKGCELIAHKTEGEKGVLFTVRYMERFSEMEETIKGQIIDYSNLSPELQMFKQIFDSVARSQLELQQMKENTDRIEQKVESIREVVALDTTSWREDTGALLRKIGTKLGGGKAYQEVRTESYKLLDKRMGVDISTRLTNLKNRMAGEGVSKSKRDSMSNLDVIERDKKLIEGYTAIVKEMAIKYGVA